MPGHPFEQGFDVRLWPDRLGLPLRWRKPRRVFVNSMSDVWHEAVPDEFIAAVWMTMFWTSADGRPGHWVGAGKHRGLPSSLPTHTYQILTKRPGRTRSWVRRWGNREQRVAWIEAAAERGWCDHEDVRTAPWAPAVLPNVWLGVSVDDQTWADRRIPALLETPTSVRFLSCKPLLGPVDLKRAVISLGSERGHGLTASYVTSGHCCQRRLHGIDWVIAGGESGPLARPMHPQWARTLRVQCAWAGVPFFLKQWSAYAPEDHGHDRGRAVLIDTQGRDWDGTPSSAPPDAVRMRRVGKKAAGRLWDNQTHQAIPV
ncbi:hypothetical protein GCM10018772_69400 [Streptomyces fumanus]|uniref:DUF5131 family protein n=1 Tax=Streptomyces fumanus TaxID=67302 RepID=A0A919B0T6_9ACTN|nr:hypothetical protein GCM10018772_69400 [Streptomyces fumanus]